jgi:fructose-1,6-bisphosphatase/inositol monophosphatase family enzyme
VLLDGERPVFAAIYEPLQDDFAWAAHGEGAWREGRRMGVADRALEDAVVLLDVSKSGVFARRPDVLPRLRRAVYRVRALGSVGIQLRDVAAGSADAFVGSRANPSPLHDVAPGALLVREAGGIATDLAGGDALRDRRSLVAASPGVHAALCALVGG